MKVLLLGARGQLGKALLRSVPDDVELIPITRKQLRITDESCYFKLLKRYQPDWVINACAYTDVEKAETECTEAYQVNCEFPFRLAYYCNLLSIKLLHMSTDYVFNGDQLTPYKPDDFCQPLNVYGESKYLGERMILNITEDPGGVVILRTSWLMSENPGNFCTKMIRLLGSQKELRVINDQWGGPTTTHSLSKAIWKIIRITKLPNVMHYCDMGQASWFDVASLIRIYASDRELVSNAAPVIPVTSSEYETAALRPSYSVLDSSETYDITGIKPTSWVETIHDIVSRIFR